MFKNFMIIAFRNLLKRKVYSFINIFGLAIGVAVCLVILKYVDFELSYDSFHKNATQIYRTTTSSYQNGEFRGTRPLSGYAQGPALLGDIPEVKAYVRTHPMYGGAVLSYMRDAGDPSTFHEDNIQFVDSTFLDVFTYRALQGDLRTALDNPKSIVITKATANKYFNRNEDPLGKVIKVSGGWADGDYEVTAVIDDVPQNSHFNFDALLPTHNLLQNGQYKQDDGWGWNNFVTYVELHPQTDVKRIEEKMPAFIDKYVGKGLAESNSKNVLQFQPILDIHLKPGLENESSATVGMNTIYFFLIISIFILAIAWINYINLSTARALERAREVGIKKAIGARRRQLMLQFIFESVLINFLGVLIAVGLAMLLLPVWGEIVNKDLSFDFTDIRFWIILIVLFAVGSLMSGAYPAFVLSSFSTIDVMKGKSKTTGGFSLRKALVVFQFASSLILIAGTFAVFRQIMFMRDQDKGLTMDQMLIVNGPRIIEGSNRRERLVTLKNELKKIPGVDHVATSAAIPGGGYNWGTSMRKDGAAREEDKGGSIVWIDPDFIETYGIQVLTGKVFDPAISSDMRSVLVNEAALTAFGLGNAEQALQERMILGDDTVAILGVLKNYHWNSLKVDHTPWLFKADTISQRNFSVHLSGANMSETIKKIEKQYKEAFPGNPFDYYFLDDFFNNQYKDDQQFASIFSLAAMLAIMIACLGLWGLASFTTTQKLKEIGIRKVLGASVGSIMSLLSWQFFKLVLIASAIGLPLTWYGVDSWLDNFAFRVGLNWDMFVVPVVILSVLALGTVSLQIFRGANSNPARILRSE
ncbi:ABC transporter permease [Parachryseolinea silvisoli]|uniref:ABC transporter permease n=1 Tax=Parachryseolinea silvisoli TaxID=2873601 RepID=UPI00295EE19D|nr:ABC transporter permease [Parachryseolinea silvisoli]